MYNRYKPQNDGTFVKKTLPDQAHSPERPSKFQISTGTSTASQHSCVPPGTVTHPAQIPPSSAKHTSTHALKPEPAGSFLKNLIPKNLDTSDLFVVLMLLLISGDCPEERNNAILTLALYLLL